MHRCTAPLSSLHHSQIMYRRNFFKHFHNLSLCRHSNPNNCLQQASSSSSSSSSLLFNVPKEELRTRDIRRLQCSILPRSPEKCIRSTCSAIDVARKSEQLLENKREELLGFPREWKGLTAWRGGVVDEGRVWGRSGPSEARVEERDGGSTCNDCEGQGEVNDFVLPGCLAECGRLVLLTEDPKRKAELTHAAFRAWTNGAMPLGVAAAPERPARPPKPELVHPREVPQPRDSPLSPSAHVLHNITHVELNAIDLAWDTVVRFSPEAQALGRQFFSDFARVADDESRHLSWCLQRLNELGFSYGDMPAHNRLWQDCEKTSGNISSRLAIIPMSQEARGLDAGPRVAERLIGFGDKRSAQIVSRIAQEELAHVAVGVAWFLRVCDAMHVDPAESFQSAIAKFCTDRPRGPFNHAARAEAGIPRHWYDDPATSHATVTETPDTVRGFREESANRLGGGSGGSFGAVRGSGACPPRTKAAAEERKKLSKEIEKLSASVGRSEELLCDPDFTTKAADRAVESVQNRHRATQSRLAEVHERLAFLMALEERNANT